MVSDQFILKGFFFKIYIRIEHRKIQITIQSLIWRLFANLTELWPFFDFDCYPGSGVVLDCNDS